MPGPSALDIDGDQMPGTRCHQQQHRRQIKQRRYDEDKPPQHDLVAGAEQRGEVADRAKVRLRHLPLAVDAGLLDL
jgi:hypothetical protein